MCVRIPGSELTPSPPAARRRSTQREDVVRVLCVAVLRSLVSRPYPIPESSANGILRCTRGYSSPVHSSHQTDMVAISMVTEVGPSQRGRYSSLWLVVLSQRGGFAHRA
ncbi:hypothetical protein BHM03_00025159 [Ensete ventricosum]|nr:hypothetical protein BHM03_00025159 [Ensete ventricosum]